MITLPNPYEVKPTTPVVNNNVVTPVPVPKQNSAMPVQPQGQKRWDPTANGGQGALVPIKPS
jgi:hypothetical protein